MDNTDRIIDMAQDMASIQSWMLTIMDALETGVMPRHFQTFNDDALDSWTSVIEEGIVKRGVKPHE